MAERYFTHFIPSDQVTAYVEYLKDTLLIVQSDMNFAPAGYINGKHFIMISYLNDVPTLTDASGTVSYEYGSEAPTYVANNLSDFVTIADGDSSAGYTLVADSSAEDMDTVGTFDVVFTVTDAAGNVSDSLSITFTITDTVAPVITMVNQTMNTEDYATWEPSVSAADAYDGVLTEIVLTYFKADGTTPLASLALARDDLYAGLVVYVHANIDDSSGNSATEKIVTVTPTDNTIPVITLTNGDESIANGDVATWDNAFTATDNKDGDLAASIVDGSGIAYYEADGITPLGTQTLAAFRTHLDNSGLGNTGVVTYDVDDAAGNSAVQKTATIVAAAL